MPDLAYVGRSDEQLARDARAGCIGSFEELARRLQVPLIRFLSRRFPSRRDAEDLTQETLLRTYQSIGRYRDGTSFRTWVFTIAYRLAASRGRSERRRLSLAVDETGGDDPLDIIERRESSQRLWQTIEQTLGPDEVAALWLFYIEALPATDVAAVMGRSWVSVKTMLHRARRKLKPILADEAAPCAGGVR